MTLFQRLVFLTMFVLMMALAGNLVSGVWSVKEHLNRQLNVNAEDAARSLAISMNTALQNQDQGGLETLMNAMFDGGEYKSIRVFGVDGRLILEKTHSDADGQVPMWFRDLINFTEVTSEAEVSNGWQQFGVIFVEPNADASYEKLWAIVGRMVGWVLLLMLGTLVMVVLFMRAVLKPLGEMEQQANAISNRDFMTIPVPKPRELRRVVMVMNGMAEKLGRIFSEQAEMTERLREMSYRDSLTGLSNRRDFVAHVSGYLDPRQGCNSGVLMLLGLSAFDKYNQAHGAAKADAVLVELANQLKHVRKDHAKITLARLKGAEFGIFIADIGREHAAEALASVFKRLSMLAAVANQQDMSDRLHIGSAYFSEQSLSSLPALDELMSLGDQALRRAQGKGRNGTLMLSMKEEPENESVMGDQAWKGYLEQVLAKQAVKLLHQPIKYFTQTTEANQRRYEVLARTDYQDNLVTASLFWPMVERYQWTEAFDRLIVTKAMSLLANQAQDLSININVSPKSISSEKFTQWLLETLKEQPRLARRVVIEVSEYALHHDAETVIDFSKQLAALHVRLSLDHFGASSGSFGYLSRIYLDHLKIDRSYVRGVDQSKDNQFYIQSLVQIAHNLDIEVFAEGVETDAEYQCLKSLGVDGGIGYLFGKPEADFL